MCQKNKNNLGMDEGELPIKMSDWADPSSTAGSGAAALRGPSDVTVQIVFSGGIDIGFEQFYSTVSTPLILGIPSANVQIYCAARFRVMRPDTWRGVMDQVNTIAQRPAVVVPDYLKYFLDVLSRAKSGHPGIPACSIRIIAGHGYGAATGSPYLKCGENIMFSELGSVATILTTIDTCNAPRAVRALKGGTFPAPNAVVATEFDQGIDFGLAASSPTDLFSYR